MVGPLVGDASRWHGPSRTGDRVQTCHPPISDALEGKGLQRQPQRRLDRRLEEVAEAVGGGYCRLQMPLRLALGVTGTVAERPGAPLPPFPLHLCPASFIPLSPSQAPHLTPDGGRTTTPSPHVHRSRTCA